MSENHCQFLVLIAAIPVSNNDGSSIHAISSISFIINQMVAFLTTL